MKAAAGSDRVFLACRKDRTEAVRGKLKRGSGQGATGRFVALKSNLTVMEQPLAILMSDLTGYTAMTETHGPSSAADLIDKYMDIVSACLHGSSRLHERTGDAVMVVAESPDDLMETARLILLHTTAVPHFLQVHGGIHYGPVLKRGSSYFGSAVNVTARIAAKAEPGSFWISSDMAAVLQEPATWFLQPKGKHSFKNVGGEIELLALTHSHPGFLIDPVCKMMIHDQGSSVPHPDHPHILFCSSYCLETYRKSEHLSVAQP